MTPSLNRAAPNVDAFEAGQGRVPGRTADSQRILAGERFDAKSRSESARLRRAAAAFLRALVSPEVRA